MHIPSRLGPLRPVRHRSTFAVGSLLAVGWVTGITGGSSGAAAAGASSVAIVAAVVAAVLMLVAVVRAQTGRREA